MGQYFSDRNGYGVADAPVVIREDAPAALRYAVVELARRSGMAPSSVRSLVCGVLVETPDAINGFSSGWGTRGRNK